MHQTMAGLGTATAVTTLACKDLRQEADFFRDKLGMEVEMSSAMPGYGLVSAGNGTYLMCYERPSAPQCDATIATFVVDDIERTVEELRGKGIRFEEYDLPDQGIKTVEGIATDPSGYKGAWFRDPAGNILAITQLTAEMKSELPGLTRM